MTRKQCACGCGAWFVPSRWTKNPRYIQGHYEASAAGKATQAKGGRNGRGNAKRRYGVAV